MKNISLFHVDADFKIYNHIAMKIIPLIKIMNKNIYYYSGF